MITRPEPGASQTAERLKALGLTSIIAPVLSISAKPIDPPRHVTAIVLASRNAVSACSSSLRDRPVFTVGNATATCARQAGFTDVRSADGDATALADLVANTLSPREGSLFLPTAQGQGGELSARLRQQGFRVVRRVAYIAVPVPTLPEAAATSLRRGQIAAVMFFSGETARHFVRLLRAANLIPAIGDVEAVSISQRATVALKPLPWRRISVAAKPNQDAMLALLQ